MTRSDTGCLFAPVFGLMPAPPVGDDVVVAWWSTLPFAALLLTIAVLPFAAPGFWHPNRNKGYVGAALSLPVVCYLFWLGPSTGWRSVGELAAGVRNYLSFVLLLGSVYVVTGGIRIRGALEGTPWTNTVLLLIGAVVSNAVGTTGASMLLIRPFLRENRERKHTRHLPVFFIFVVGNLGGLLTPLGDPPLFLGYRGGVPFAWTFGLWPHWLVANGTVLTTFFAWDTVAYLRETPEARAREHRAAEPLRVSGRLNILLLGLIVLGVVLDHHGGAVLLLLAAGLSLALTPAAVRTENQFGWGALAEVAVLFAGIFVTMVPALVLLRHPGRPEVTAAWQYFWVSGALSSVLDNAPTYVATASLAAGPHDFGWLAETRPAVLQAVSCGSVFMGANTYIGNGPNLMVKAIAEEHGFAPPSFFAYMGYSAVVLGPTFLLVTVLFFR